MTIPMFKLYGENHSWPTPDLIHCESIPKRSSLYQWEIQPHQHADLYQLFYIQSGSAHVEIEGVKRSIPEASIQVIPPLFVHGFHFSEDIEGYVLTLAAPLVAQLETQLSPKLSTASCYPVRDAKNRLNSLFSALLYEYEGQELLRDSLLQALVNALTVWLARQNNRNDSVSNSHGRGRETLRAFLKQVEQHYRKHWSVEEYAHSIAVSGTYLNSLCRSQTGHSALQLIHQRLLLEAKRNLIYTTMSVAQIADALGFSDPGYFSRFFKRMSGQTANSFRQQRPSFEDTADSAPEEFY